MPERRQHFTPSVQSAAICFRNVNKVALIMRLNESARCRRRQWGHRDGSSREYMPCARPRPCRSATPDSARLGRRRLRAHRAQAHDGSRERQPRPRSPRPSTRARTSIAALLTFFAVGVAARPADRSHPYGHGKAEHLAALAEAAVLVLVSIGVAVFAVLRLTGVIETEVERCVVGVRGCRRGHRHRPLADGRLAARGAALFERRAALERAPLRQRPGRHASQCSAGSTCCCARLAAGRLGGGALRRRPRRHRGRAG